MTRKILALGTLVGLLWGPTATSAKVRIVASTSDLASIAEMVGGDLVQVESIVTGKKDPHFVEILPSYMIKVARADIYLKVGGDLDYWADRIIDGSQNARLLIVDCSQGIDFLEKPTTRIDASLGDIHRQGNPHYWLDPENGRIVARTIAEALSKADPGNAESYGQGFERFGEELDRRTAEWRSLAEPLRGLEVVTYHNSWPYFARAFGLKIVGFVEPKPGIEPTPSHTAQLIAMVKSSGIRIIVKEPYFSSRTPDAIARETGAVVVELPPSVGGTEDATDYFRLFDALLQRLMQAKGG